MIVRPFEKPDGEVLLRNLASICLQQKTHPASGHRQLHRFVLKTKLDFEQIPAARLWAVFFMRPCHLSI